MENWMQPDETLPAEVLQGAPQEADTFIPPSYAQMIADREAWLNQFTNNLAAYDQAPPASTVPVVSAAAGYGGGAVRIPPEGLSMEEPLKFASPAAEGPGRLPFPSAAQRGGGTIAGPDGETYTLPPKPAATGQETQNKGKGAFQDYIIKHLGFNPYDVNPYELARKRLAEEDDAIYAEVMGNRPRAYLSTEQKNFLREQQMVRYRQLLEEEKDKATAGKDLFKAFMDKFRAEQSGQKPQGAVNVPQGGSLVDPATGRLIYQSPAKPTEEKATSATQYKEIKEVLDDYFGDLVAADKFTGEKPKDIRSALTETQRALYDDYKKRITELVRKRKMDPLEARDAVTQWYGHEVQDTGEPTEEGKPAKKGIYAAPGTYDRLKKETEAGPAGPGGEAIARQSRAAGGTATASPGPSSSRATTAGPPSDYNRPPREDQEAIDLYRAIQSGRAQPPAIGAPPGAKPLMHGGKPVTKNGQQVYIDPKTGKAWWAGQ